MKWIGERISFVDKKDHITFVIYPPKIGIKLHLIISWVILWYIIGGVVFSQLFGDYEEKEKIILIVFLSFWLYYAVKVTKTLAYLIWGREYLKLDPTSLRIKRATGKYGKAKQYFLENISKFSIYELKENSFQASYEKSDWVMGTNKLHFEDLGKTISFGRKLNEKDATLLFKLITKRIEQYLRKS